MEIKAIQYDWPLMEALIEIKRDNLRYYEIEEYIKLGLYEELMTKKHSQLLDEFKMYTGEDWEQHPQATLVN
jgi:hypothetical protein